MRCSACATKLLRPLFDGIVVVTSTTSALQASRHLYSTRSRRFHNASSTTRRLSTAAHAINTPQDSVPIAINDGMKYMARPESGRKQLRQLRTRSNAGAKIESSEVERGWGTGIIKQSYAIGDPTVPEGLGESEAMSSEDSSFDFEWWRKNTRDPERDVPPKHSPEAPGRQREVQTTVQSDKKANPSTKHTPASPKFPKTATATPEPRQPPKQGSEAWQVQKAALAAKFGSTGWSPRKRLSPDTMDGIRSLHAQYPTQYTTPVLADQFKVSPEAIRRILKSKWRPNDEEEEKRRERWEKRGEKIWTQLVDMGVKPPRKWRGRIKRKEEPKGRKQPIGEGKSSYVKEMSLGRSPEKAKDRITTSPMFRPEAEYQVSLADRIL